MSPTPPVGASQLTFKGSLVWSVLIGAIGMAVTVAWGVRGVTDAVDRAQEIANQHSKDLQQLPELRASIDRLNETVGEIVDNSFSAVDMEMWVLEFRSQNSTVMIPDVRRR